jgi:exopolysaccharide biosynthesis polyprenyl glycosylphosphotransferase
MVKRFSTNFMVILFLADVVAIQVALALAMHLRFVLPFGQALSTEWVGTLVYSPTLTLRAAVGIIWAISMLLGSVYVPRRVIFWMEEFQHVALSHTVAALSLAGILYIAKKELPRLTFFYLFAVGLVLLLGYRLVLRIWFRLHRNSDTDITRVLVVGAGRVGQNLVTKLRSENWSGLEIVGFLDDDPEKRGANILDLPVLSVVDNAVDAVQEYSIDQVFIALPLHAHKRMANLVAHLNELPVRLYVLPDYFDLAFHAASIESIGGIPMIGLRDPAIDGFERFGKRLMDIVISATVLLFFMPVMIAVALAIKLEDGGPVFYRAERVGENGRIFKMLKFRSMIVDADKLQHLVSHVDDNGNVVYKTAQDPRVTRTGRLIRRASIDELPQLINVLKADMSLVGPRPELPWLVDDYEPWQRKRFAVPQGITGWWQINGRSDNPMYMHTDQDLYYIQHYSWWLDIFILWRTVSVVLRGKGAY